MRTRFEELKILKEKLGKKAFEAHMRDKLVNRLKVVSK